MYRSISRVSRRGVEVEAVFAGPRDEAIIIAVIRVEEYAATIVADNLRCRGVQCMRVWFLGTRMYLYGLLPDRGGPCRLTLTLKVPGRRRDLSIALRNTTACTPYDGRPRV